MPFIQKYLNAVSNFSRYIKGIILSVSEVGGNSYLRVYKKHYFRALERKVKFSLVPAAGIKPIHFTQLIQV